ncbi:MAG TPA: zinc ribbon domain-containing protein [Polyangiaceae bacterium]|nr:zinc ribbon domain-containing protein [Polyangiaceae bacterium]
MTYDYVCTACGHEWEAEQRISEDPLKTCPKCEKDAAKRQISGGAGFILKGGGWYADLYSSAKPGAKGDSDKSESKASDTKKDKKSSDSSAKADTSKPSSGGSGDKPSGPKNQRAA